MYTRPFLVVELVGRRYLMGGTTTKARRRPDRTVRTAERAVFWKRLRRVRWSSWAAEGRFRQSSRVMMTGGRDVDSNSITRVYFCPIGRHDATNYAVHDNKASHYTCIRAHLCIEIQVLMTTCATVTKPAIVYRNILAHNSDDYGHKYPLMTPPTLS